MTLLDFLEELRKRKNHYLLNNQRWAIILALFFSILFLITLIILGALSILMGSALAPAWLISIFFIIPFIRNFISTASSLGRTVDLATLAINQEQPSTLISKLTDTKLIPDSSFSKKELIFTLLGLGIGILAFIGISLTDFKIPYLGIIPPGLAHVLFAMASLGIFAGLGNRIGLSLSETSIRLQSEKYAMLIAFILGMTLASIMLATNSFAFIHIPGLTGFFADAGIFKEALFFLTFSSLLVSFADNCARSLSFIKYLIGNDDEIEKHFKGRLNEYRGAFVGSIAGLFLSGIAVTILLIFFPELFPSLLLCVTGMATLMIATVNVIAGLCSSIGCYIDGFYKDKQNSSKASLTLQNDKEAPVLSRHSSLASLSKLQKEPGPRDSRATSSDTDEENSLVPYNFHRELQEVAKIRDEITVGHPREATKEMPLPRSPFLCG